MAIVPIFALFMLKIHPRVLVQKIEMIKQDQRLTKNTLKCSICVSSHLVLKKEERKKNIELWVYFDTITKSIWWNGPYNINIYDIYTLMSVYFNFEKNRLKDLFIFLMRCRGINLVSADPKNQRFRLGYQKAWLGQPTYLMSLTSIKTNSKWLLQKWHCGLAIYYV